MNAPFSIGQKVVCINDKNVSKYSTLKKGEIYTVLSITFCVCGRWSVGYRDKDGDETANTCAKCGKDNPMGKHRTAKSERFASIQTNYADATAEILEKFKPTEDTPDKILIPEKLKSIS